MINDDVCEIIVKKTQLRPRIKDLLLHFFANFVVQKSIFVEASKKVLPTLHQKKKKEKVGKIATHKNTKISTCKQLLLHVLKARL